VKKYHPLPADDKEMLEVRERLFNGEEVDYVILYNSRNIRRKMTSDILLAFDTFMKALPEEKRKKCRMVMHTQKVDEHGTDLPVVIRDVVPDIAPYVIFSDERIEAKHINILYNIADVTINLSSNEGFGLGTCESIIAGTPIIVNVTGGLQDQCGFVNHEGEYLDPERDFTYEWGSNADGRFRKHGDWAFPVFPVSRSLQGSPLTPYIFDDRASWKEAGERLLEVYNLGREERKRRGELGRQYALGPGQFTAERMCELFIQDMERAWENWTPRERFTLVKA
jgi:glycosyltransferase involved in cell wall biosynthesis